jgi:hypothetical protein
MATDVNKLNQKFMKYKILILIISIQFILSCGKNKECKTFGYIDLSIKHKHSINSFRIERDGRATVLINKIYEDPKLYQIKFDEKEMNYIKKSLSNISLIKCDSISNHYMDGMQYIFILNDEKGSVTLLSDTCVQLKSLDNLVSYIDKIFIKKEKTYFYKSVEGLIPPPPPSVPSS